MESAELVKKGLALVPHPAWLCTPNGLVTAWNPCAEKAFAVPTEETTEPQPWWTVLEPSDSAVLGKTWERSADGTEPFDITCQFRMGNGDLRWHLVRTAPTTVKVNGRRLWAVTATDIESERCALAAVQATAERYRHFVAQSSEAIWRFELERPIDLSWSTESQIEHLYRYGFLAECNDAFARMLGKTHARELIGARLDVLLPRDRPQHLDYVRQLVRTQFRSINVPTQGADASGRELYTLNSFIADVENGRAWRAWGTSRDVTPEREVRAKLEESELRFRSMADAAPVMIWVADQTKAATYFNQAWLEFTGRPFEMESKQGWFDGVHPDDRDRYWNGYTAAFQSREPFEIEYRLRRHDGEFRWVLDRGVPRLGFDASFLGFIGVCTEVHEQKLAIEKMREDEARLQSALADAQRAREAAETANRAKDEFLAALSHELRTPLTPVLMTASALEIEAPHGSELRQQLGIIRQNVELEARLIDDLLDLTRISRGKLQLRPVATDVHSLLEHTNEIVRSDRQTKQLDLKVRLEAAEFHVEADPARLQQVFWNLMKNSIKFTPDDGSITIRTFNPEPGRLVVQVTDTGIGIEPAHLPHIFDAFDQGALAGQHRFGGLGLGLAISKAVVDMHGGSIRAESSGHGKGSTFTVQLNTTAAPADPQKPATVDPGAEPPLRLLLVEDHGPTLAVLNRVLQRRGHTVTTATTVQEALIAAKGSSFDLVISDLGLPDGSGLDLMRELQSRHSLKGIALSGYGMEEDIARTRAAGFRAHLIKPVNFDQLRETLRYFGTHDS